MIKSDEMSLPNLGLLSLRELTELGGGIAAGGKEQKEKKHTKNAKTTPYASIPMQKFDTDEKPAVDIPTSHESGRSTEAERRWLQDKYGIDWSNVPESQKQRMIAQARKALSYIFAPLIKKALEDVKIETTAKFNKMNFTEAGAPKLDWVKEVVPLLNSKHGPDWRKGPDGKWLSQEAKDARANEAKNELRAEKLPQLLQQLEALVAQKQQEMFKRQVEELNFPDLLLKRKGRALCRHWFNRKGKDGKLRKWYSDDSTDVPKAMGKRRLEWAKTVVGLPSYDPSNPPRPPIELYLPLDVKPIEESYLPDMVEAISNKGGQWLWKFMRQLEEMNIEATQDYSGELGDIDYAAQYWTPAFREAQKQMLKESYQEFIESVNEMSDIPNAKDVAYSYTVGSGKFNKYLLWPSSKVGGDPTKIPDYGQGAGGVAGSIGSGVIGPPDALHRLYKLINRCPRLDQPAVFLRSVRRTHDLPHNLGKETLVQPVVGRGYLNVTFMSTSSAPPDQYLDGALGNFYDSLADCCMYAITAPKGSPVLPLVLGGTAYSAYASEQEVVFPPGLVLVYQGQKKLAVGSSTATIHFYQAALPPSASLQPPDPPVA